MTCEDTPLLLETFISVSLLDLLAKVLMALNRNTDLLVKASRL